MDTPAGRATLRRQGMGDAALRSRLDPAITLEAWRHFINGQVFLCATLADAVRLLRAEPTRAQTIIVFAAAELLKAGCELRFCTFNNGYIDRSPPHRRRLRHYDDYQPVAAWTPGTNIREIAIAGGIPATVGFEVTMLPD